MSSWTYVSGMITVSPMGRTQHEKTYILNTVLDHLPRVTGSKGDMNVYVIQKIRTRDDYILVVEVSFRDRYFEETLKEFNKWLCRLAKRVTVHDVLVEIKDRDKSFVISDNKKYRKMKADASWVDKDSYNWCECLMRK